MTYIRRLVRGDNVYLYEVTSYRDKETGKVKQKSVYKGKEIVKDNTVMSTPVEFFPKTPVNSFHFPLWKR